MLRHIARSFFAAASLSALLLAGAGCSSSEEKPAPKPGKAPAASPTPKATPAPTPEPAPEATPEAAPEPPPAELAAAPTPEATPTEEELAEAFLAQVPKQVEALLEAHRMAGDGVAREKAAEALAALGEPAMREVARLLKSRDVKLREQGMQLRPWFDELPEADAAFLQAEAQSPVPEAREAALAMFESNPETASPEALVRLLFSEDDAGRRLRAVALMGQLRDARSLAPLRVALKRDKDPAVRAAAARALGQLGDPRALGPLGKAKLSDRDAGARLAAEEAIALIAAQAEAEAAESSEADSSEGADEGADSPEG